MAAEDQDSRTELPTARRLSKAREEGDIFKSVEVQSLAVLLAAIVFVWLSAPWMARHLSDLLAGYLAKVSQLDTDENALRLMFAGLARSVGMIVVVPIGVTFVFVILATLSQTGLSFSPDRLLNLNWGALNPIAGFARLFTLRRGVDFLKSLFKLLIITTVIAMVVVPHFIHPDLLVQQDPREMLSELQMLVIRLIFATILTFVGVAVLDWLWERKSYITKLKMTKQEIKDEHRQSDGDPMVKARIAQMRMKRARERMMAAVPQATVVITNPTHYAIALLYDMETMPAPKLVAKGVDNIARKIRELAEENEVPIIENPPLARTLYASVEIDQDIPPEHYKAVAEVIGFVMRLKGRRAPPRPTPQRPAAPASIPLAAGRLPPGGGQPGAGQPRAGQTGAGQPPRPGSRG